MPYRRAPPPSITTGANIAAAAGGGAGDLLSSSSSVLPPRWRRAVRLGLTGLVGTYIITASVLLLAVDHNPITTASSSGSDGAAVGSGEVTGGASSSSASYRVLSGSGSGGGKRAVLLDYVKERVRGAVVGAAGRRARGGSKGRSGEVDEEEGSFYMGVKEVFLPDATAIRGEEEEEGLSGAIAAEEQEEEQQQEAVLLRVPPRGSEEREKKADPSAFHMDIKEVFNPPTDEQVSSSSALVDSLVLGAQAWKTRGVEEGEGGKEEGASSTEGKEEEEEQQQQSTPPLRVSPMLVPRGEWVEEDERYYVPLSPDDPIEEYIRRHHDRAQSSSRQEEGQGAAPSDHSQFVAFVPDEGFGNRLRGAYSTFLLSMLLDRTFLLFWTKPCHWSLQFNNTMPWEWDMTRYPALYDGYAASSPRVQYMCLTQFLKGCENRTRHRAELEGADLQDLYKDKDLLIVQDPDEYISLLQSNPIHGAEAKRIVEWDGDPYNRTYVERFMGRFLEPSADVLAMMAPYRGRYTHAIHVRSEFCKRRDFDPLLTLLKGYISASEEEGVRKGRKKDRTWYLAVDKADHRETLLQEMRGLEEEQQQEVEGHRVIGAIMYIDLPPVHSNDRLPSHASNDSYVSLMADFFLLSEAPGNRYLTDQSSFSEAVQYVSVGSKWRKRRTTVGGSSSSEGDPPPFQDYWFCGRARDGKKAEQ